MKGTRRSHRRPPAVAKSLQEAGRESKSAAAKSGRAFIVPPIPGEAVQAIRTMGLGIATPKIPVGSSGHGIGIVRKPFKPGKVQSLVPVVPEFIKQLIEEISAENRLSARSVKRVREIAKDAKIKESDGLYFLEVGKRIVQVLGNGILKEFGFFNDKGKFEYAKDEGQLNQWLQKYFEENNLPQSQWPAAATEISHVLRKQLIAATERPQWDDRAKYPELANLSAPQFLKHVWADQFNADGSIARDLVSDKKLLRIVGVYMDSRRSRNLDLGDAKGMRLIRGKAGRPARPSAG